MCWFLENFWTLIRSNALGMALAFAFSFGSLSVSDWLYEYLYQLPEKRLAGAVVAEIELPPLPMVIDPARLNEQYCLGEDEQSESFPERCEHLRGDPILRLKPFTVPLLLGPYSYKVLVIVFYLHAALMMIVYFALCRHLSGLGNRSREAVQS